MELTSSRLQTHKRKRTMINRETVLSKTHYGLRIYAHILRQFYPNDTVMFVSGRDCGLCRNPFTGDSLTLHVWIHKTDPTKQIAPEIALHKDTNSGIPEGDCFSFAELYYHQSGQELLETLNKEMNLHLEDGYSFYSGTSYKPKPIGPKFTFFKAPISNTRPYKDITIVDAYNYITGEYAMKRTQHLRSITDPKKAKLYKAANFDYCTFSGIFDKRSDKHLKTHSGLICLDFDHVPNLEALFESLKIDPYLDTKLLFRSPSGDGLKWIVTIDIYKGSHLDYFRAISNYVKQTYHHEIDRACKDISRACFLAHDPFAYINLQNQ